MWRFSIYRLIYPKERYIWTQVRILHETEKAILVTASFLIARSETTKQSQNDNIKIWIAKSQIYGIRLRNNNFEIYVKKGIVG